LNNYIIIYSICLLCVAKNSPRRQTKVKEKYNKA
jgi:hypothetical protein